MSSKAWQVVIPAVMEAKQLRTQCYDAKLYLLGNSSLMCSQVCISGFNNDQFDLVSLGNSICKEFRLTALAKQRLTKYSGQEIKITTAFLTRYTQLSSTPQSWNEAERQE